MDHGKSLDVTRPTAVTISTALYVLAGAYAIVFPILYDVTMVQMLLIAILSFTAAIGTYQMRRWGLWTALILFPVIIVSAGFAFRYSTNLVGINPNWQVLAFHISLILYMAISAISLILVLDKRKEFK